MAKDSSSLLLKHTLTGTHIFWVMINLKNIGSMRVLCEQDLQVVGKPLGYCFSLKAWIFTTVNYYLYHHSLWSKAMQFVIARQDWVWLKE